MNQKTIAYIILTFNDLPVEVVSELLGHSSMKITQEYYGKVVHFDRFLHTRMALCQPYAVINTASVVKS